MGSPVQSKGKGSIRKRLAFMICMIAALLVGIQTALGLFLGLNVMSYIVGEDHKRLAVVLSNATSQMIDDEVKKLEDISSAPAWKDATVSGNLKYISMDDDSIAKYMAEMDKRWADSENSGPFIKLYTDSSLSAEMTDIIKENNEIAEIMLTDMRGALIAASGETTDFYQGDEDWWQKAFAGGDGRKFIGEVSFDESANVLAIAFAFPVQGGGLGPGRAAGVMKVVVNTDKFFEPL
ncbi:MAG: hypothetical protein Q7S82_03800, partial [bacterium]|nr:hypothetical protein [bacterium]